jgi:anti-sigma B factor antagonist
MAKGDVLFRQEGTLGFLDFPRDVTAQTRETAYGAYNELARAKVKSVALNFDQTDYMNSAGIGLVISLVEDATQAGRRVFAFGLASHYRKLFNMVGLMERITLATDEADAKSKAFDGVPPVAPATPAPAASTTPAAPATPTPSSNSAPPPAPATTTPSSNSAPATPAASSTPASSNTNTAGGTSSSTTPKK